jgi:hypothetical protein
VKSNRPLASRLLNLLYVGFAPAAHFFGVPRVIGRPTSATQGSLMASLNYLAGKRGVMLDCVPCHVGRGPHVTPLENFQ